MKRLTVTDINVKKYWMIINILIDKQHKYSNAAIKTLLLREIPTLAFHKCKNNNNENLVSIMSTTSVAHLFEHIIIDFQIDLLTQNNVLENYEILGTTEWISEASGTAKIQINYFDDIVALKAIKNAENFINKILDTYILHLN